MKKRVAIFVSGGGSNMRALVESMDDTHAAEPVLVLSNNPQSDGIEWARGQGLNTEVVDHRAYGKDRAAFEAQINAVMAPYAPDIICLAGFMRVLAADFVNPWAGRMLNIHPSLLPKFPGLHTHKRALEAKEREHGCTVHLVTPVMDEGPVLGQARVPVKSDDTPETLAMRVLLQEHKLYPAILRRFAAGDATPVSF